ncbi:MAG: glycogen synthase GlgA [Acidobacteriota bacterium]
MDRLNILFITSEASPYAKTGGLADVSEALPKALTKLGHKVNVIMPLYRQVMEGNFNLKPVNISYSVPVGRKEIEAKVFKDQVDKNLTFYFIKRDEFFDRSRLYGTADGDYLDNAERFIFFSRGVLGLAEASNITPHIIHANDWQSALVPVFLRKLFRNASLFQKTKSVFTIHNLAYQGVFPQETMAFTGLSEELFSINGLEFYGKVNFIKGGIVFSDAVTTVSRKYAEEIQTSEYGHGMEGVLKEKAARLFGVLNGVDYSQWNPETDSLLPANYRAEDLSGKAKCKSELKKAFGLKDSDSIPLIGMISRLAGQKGFDILVDALKKLKKENFQFVLLGQGEAHYENLLSRMAENNPEKWAVKIAFDNKLAHLIEAGSDMFLMPSRYEPCGLNQMYSLKYGTIPIVRATGGLNDTISEIDPEQGKGNGFKFKDYSASALCQAILKALRFFKDKPLWHKLIKNAMKEDFSWERSAGQYEEIYRQLLA